MPVVLLAIDACTPLEQLLPAALLLAAQDHAALHGIFSHDNRLPQGAALPFTYEVGGNSAACYPVTAESIDRRVRCIAEKMRRRLAAAAERQQIPWEFETSSGSISQITRETEAEVVFPGWYTNLSATTARVRKSMPGTSSKAAIVVVDDGSPSSAQVINAAQRLGKSTGRHQTIILKLLSDHERPGKDSGVSTELRPPSGKMNEAVIRVSSMRQLIRHLRQLHPSIVLLGREQKVVEDSQLLKELAFIKCPVGLLRTGP